MGKKGREEKGKGRLFFIFWGNIFFFYGGGFGREREGRNGEGKFLFFCFWGRVIIGEGKFLFFCFWGRVIISEILFFYPGRWQYRMVLDGSPSHRLSF